MTPPRRPRGLFHEITEVVYWLLVIDVLMLLAAVPSIALWLLLVPGPVGTPLFVLAALPLLPAIAGSLHACTRWRAERDLEPVRQFLRGYRLNIRDSLAVGTPLLALLAALALARSLLPASGSLLPSIAQLVLAALALLALVRSLSITSRFSFRARDALRLTAFTLLARPAATLSLLSLCILTTGLLLLVGEFLVPVIASPLLVALWFSERPVLAMVQERFVSPAGATPDGPPGPRPHEGS